MLPLYQQHWVYYLTLLFNVWGEERQACIYLTKDQYGCFDQSGFGIDCDNTPLVLESILETMFGNNTSEN